MRMFVLNSVLLFLSYVIAILHKKTHIIADLTVFHNFISLECFKFLECRLVMVMRSSSWFTNKAQDFVCLSLQLSSIVLWEKGGTSCFPLRMV
jgi:hypothetical protein